MKVYRLTGVRGAALEQVEVECPEPGPRQILVRMRAAALNHRDLIIARGHRRSGAGLVPMSDGAGEVAALGAGVSRFTIGDLIMGCFHPRWIYGSPNRADLGSALGGGVDGVLAEYCVFHEEAAIRAPKGYDAHRAATLPCAALTAWSALRHVRADQTVLLLGTGGVSIFALQFAKAAGARVIATSSSDAKIEQLRLLGADATINYRAQPDWDREVNRLTDSRGVDIVVEVGGGGTLNRSLASVASGGEVALIGVLTTGELDPMAILYSGASVRAIVVGSREMFETMVRWIETHGIQPAIDRTFAFSEAPEAYHYLQSAAHIGKVVIDIS